MRLSIVLCRLGTAERLVVGESVHPTRNVSVVGIGMLRLLKDEWFSARGRALRHGERHGGECIVADGVCAARAEGSVGLKFSWRISGATARSTITEDAEEGEEESAKSSADADTCIKVGVIVDVGS